MTDTVYRRTILTALALLATALYAFTLNFPFVFDDSHYIVNNLLIKDSSYFLGLFNIREFARIDNILKIDPDLTTSFILRPVSYLTFSFNYYVHGLNPMGYRLVNVTLHSANAALLYLCLANILMLSPAYRPRTSLSTRFIPTVATLLFLVHPLQTQSVTYVIQRFTTLATTLYLLTIYLYLRARASVDKKHIRLFRLFSLLSLLTGMLTKELLFTAPFALLLIETVLLGERPVAAFKRVAPYFLCLPLIPVLITVTAAAQSDSQNAMGGMLNIVNYNRYSSLSYLITQLCVIVTYLRMLLLPYGQNIDPDYPLYTSLLQGRPLLSLIVIVTLCALSFAFFCRRRHDQRSSLLLFGTVWFFLTISIDSSIVPLPDLMAEQRVYLPSIGIFMLLATMADMIRTSLSTARHRNMLFLGIALWCIALSTVTIVRNTSWRSEISIWKDATAKSPHKARPWNTLGIAYATQAYYAEAVPCFLRAGSIYLNRKQYGEASEACIKGLTLDPANSELYRILGIAYLELGQLDDAEHTLRQAINFNPGDSYARLVLARVYFAKKQVGAAQDQLREAAKDSGLDPRLKEEIRQLEGVLSDVQ